MKTKTKSRRPATAAHRRALNNAGLGCSDDVAVRKERRLRQWAARVVSEMPPDLDEARRILQLASDLLETWTHVPMQGEYVSLKTGAR